ncbi:ArsR/SmtB family transcription factor [Amycolatopsis cihanbeyliensis]|uniref:DNA-binding transcriptional ArsR family regulator n=1 Tax=Amycolatopsis cihanbeyliensis TaxID=1128664 RepID=A0A542DF62_AMYCI|nr:metalloregulator ArsR/SmtB family transcription factor [Amycolatopsis cihanbeyliensis]TQJ01683.1 DNA-binding transcriptional ArsR family regulator [Amycolatopsis cihanbeyliensis]
MGWDTGHVRVDEVGSLAVLPTGESIVTLDELAESASLFKALGDPVRVKLVALVRRTPDGEACFCDLADEFDMPQSSLSHHLKILVRAGVLARERRGTWSWYRIRPEPLEIMETLLRPGGPLREPPGDVATQPNRCD